AHLPDGLSCSHCVLQWRYHAGNSWGIDIETGKSCLDCGHQEEFYNCADISIAPEDNNLLLSSSTTTTTTTTHEPLFVFPYFDSFVFPSGIEHFPMFAYPTTTTTEPTTTTTTTIATTMHAIFPLHPSKEYLNQINKNNKTRRCYPTNEVLKPIVGIEHWCLHLCAVHCPPTLCACVQI
ncbi:unnamed protein product, partial [Rotaria sp. Silwood1]